MIKQKLIVEVHGRDLRKFLNKCHDMRKCTFYLQINQNETMHERMEMNGNSSSFR
jgi:hypothetical protein